MKPILFNTEMVRAILDGRKKVTRRLINPQPTYSPMDGFKWKGNAYGTNLPPTVEGAACNFICAAPYKVNDILYVRETWCSAYDGEKYFYLADRVTEREQRQLLDYYNVKWRPSIHMPKEAARIFLKVTAVNVERLQDISGGEILKEGIEKSLLFDGGVKNAFDKFAGLWDSTIRATDLELFGWNANPYVWVIEFEVIDK